MNARTIILTIAAAALIAAPSAVFAQNGPGDCDGTGPHGPQVKGGPGGPGGPDGLGLVHMIPRMAEDIGLTDTQLAQIEAIVDAQLPAIHELMDQARTAAETFRSNHGPGDFDETEYRAFFESQDKIHLEAKLLGARAVAQVWDVLNADQQQQVLDKLDAMGPGQGNGKRFGGGRRFGRR